MHHMYKDQINNVSETYRNNIILKYFVFCLRFPSGENGSFIYKKSCIRSWCQKSFQIQTQSQPVVILTRLALNYWRISWNFIRVEFQIWNFSSSYL